MRQELQRARLVGGDTMNYWINHKRDDLLQTLKLMDLLLINDTEAKMLAGESNQGVTLCWEGGQRFELAAAVAMVDESCGELAGAVLGDAA